MPATSSRANGSWSRSEEHTSELQSRFDLVCRLLLEKNNQLRCTARTADAVSGQAGWHGRTGDPGVRLRHFQTAARVFFFNDTATTEIYTLSLHDALPI